MSVADQLREEVTAVAGERSSAEIARAAGVSESLLSRFIAGQRTLRLRNAEHLARALGLRLELRRGRGRLQ